MDGLRIWKGGMGLLAACAVLAGCQGGGTRYPCRDADSGFFGNDPCWVEEHYTYTGTTYLPAPGEAIVHLADLDMGWQHRPDSLRVHLGADFRPSQCHDRVWAGFPGVPPVGDTVRSDTLQVGGWHPLPGDDRECVSKASAGEAYLTTVYDRKVADDLGPAEGVEVRYRYRLSWSGKAVTGDLVYTRKSLYHE